MGRKKHEEEHENHERWLVSYADMITLLMVFFIILYASSMLNVSKFMAFKDSAHRALGSSAVAPPKPKESPGDNPTTEPKKPTDTKNPQTASTATAETKTSGGVDVKALQQLAAKVKQQVHKDGLDKSVEVTVDQRGVILVFTDRVLFASGQADITTAGSEILRKVAPILLNQPMPIIVEGHTDNQPISSVRYPTNWELSTARATNVLRDLIDHLHLSPNRMSAAGYADTHPRARNNTVEGRAKNRRVEIVIVAPKAASRAGVAIPNPTASPTATGTPAATATPAPSAKATTH